MSNIFKIAITMGDPGGIGPEVIIKSLACPDKKIPAVYVLIGMEEVFNKTARALGEKFNYKKASRIKDIADKEGTVYLIEPKAGADVDYVTGNHSKTNGRMALEALKAGVSLALNKEVDVLVTAPVSKQAISAAGARFTGHTEFIAQQTRAKYPVMLFVTDKLKVALLTTHLAYRKVPLHLTAPNIISTIETCNAGLKKYFGMVNPKIAVCGLNPHASEGGILGQEEKTIILPALETARKAKINCSGPFPADTVFRRAIEKEFDAVIALYHDQGLAPLKTLEPYKGVNITLGLPFIRTSVMHGTAFDIAGKGIANKNSMQYAIRTAYQMYHQELIHKGENLFNN
jgi:4-hydroxythreonine-4-phosphate dehydrogenase